MVKGTTRLQEPRIKGAELIRAAIRECYLRPEGGKRRKHAVIPDALKEKILLWADENGKWTQKQLAEAIGVDKGQFNQILVKTRRRLEGAPPPAKGASPPSAAPARWVATGPDQARAQKGASSAPKGKAKAAAKGRSAAPPVAASQPPPPTEVIYLHQGSTRSPAVVEVEVPSQGSRYVVIVIPGARVSGPFEDAVRLAERLIRPS